MSEIILAPDRDIKTEVFIFHGYGADKNDMAPLGKEISENIPNVEVRIADGFEHCPSGYGYQWFDMVSDEITDWERALAEKTPDMMKYIDNILAEKNLSYSDAVIAGFSQGAMLALSLGLQNNFRAAISFSGMLLNPQVCQNSPSTKVLLCHGESDDVVPFEMMKITESALQAAKIHVETATSPNLHHAIDKKLVKSAVDFLKNL